MPLFLNLKKLKYFLGFAGVSLLMFDIGYYMMSVLPGTRNYMCVEGGNLTLLNISFTVVLSLMMGVLVIGFIELFTRNYVEKKFALTSMSGFGAIIGAMTLVCPICTLPVIPLLGAAAFLNFVAEYALFFKIISVGFMFWSLYLLNKQLKNECVMCKQGSCEVG